MEETLYFAYGSNINLEQMEHRCPDALLVGPVTLQNYELQFRGSGFATVAPTFPFRKEDVLSAQKK